ncbi:hypothetical protein ACQKDD_18030 [Planococcus kocurii]|uniref:hypothetical protein n=1 Tax=Planococcus kocurii TaxID=1374 RepID=UPI003CFD6644
MNLMSMLSGNGFIMCNKELAREVSLNASIIFGQLCSSHESFRQKGMLTIYENKEYFFLISEKIQEETTLSYKLQAKAIKELQSAGYLEVIKKGIPAKNFYHITDKVYDRVLEGKSSSDQKEQLSAPTVQEIETAENVDMTSVDQKETLEMTNEHSRYLPEGTYINKKKEKEIYNNKNKNLNLNTVDIYEVLQDTSLPKLIQNKIKVMIASKTIKLTIQQVLQIENSYNHQKSKGYIIPECASDYTEALNDYEFANTLEKMLKSVPDIHNMQGMIQKWTKIAYTFKKDEHHPIELGNIKSSKFYNWLEE